MQKLLVIFGLLASVMVIESRMMDMSHTINERARHGVLFRNFSITPAMNGSYGTSKVWFQTNDIALSEHTGTHMDAPVHSMPGAQFLHEIPYQKLVGPAVVLDVSEHSTEDYEVTIADIEEYEATFGLIQDGAIVFLSTGGSQHYTNYKKYTNSETPWDFRTYHFPGFHPDAVSWLIKERNINGIGSDRLVFDIGKDVDYRCHHVLGANNVYGLENVANAEKIPQAGATVVVLPMPIERGTGAPTRILAFWGKDNKLSVYSGGNIIGISLLLMIMGIAISASM